MSGMGIPRVVIVGRPNVGKSTLFNALVGQRVAIEDPMAGVTRDRVSFVLDHDNHSVELIDTGGIGQFDEAALAAEIEEQITAALDLADIVMFVIDAKQGVLPQDKGVAARLRGLSVPVVLVANKVEATKDAAGVGEAHGLGFGDPWAVSAKERIGLHDLRSHLFELAGPDALRPLGPDVPIRLGIVGRMNVGKSTLVNALVEEERVIVSDIPGTTRDAVDVPFMLGARRFTAIDTAGMRKARTISDSVEFYGQSRAERAIRRADVVLIMLDATRDIGRLDKQIAGQVADASVPSILVVNKWDLARDRSDPLAYETYLRSHITGLPFAPIAFMSAKESAGLVEMLNLASELHDQAGRRVSTGEINRVLRSAYQRRRPRPMQGRIGKIYYASQVATYPPTIVVFVNSPDAFEDSWRRFLLHEIQDALPFPEIPVRLRFIARGEGHAPGGGHRGRDPKGRRPKGRGPGGGPVRGDDLPIGEG